MIKLIIRILFPRILKCYSGVDTTFAWARGLPADWQIRWILCLGSCVFDKHKSQQVLQWRIRDPIWIPVIQRARGISAVRANKGGSCLEWLFGAPTGVIRSGVQLGLLCCCCRGPWGQEEFSLHIFLCTATASLPLGWAPQSPKLWGCFLAN